MESCKRQAKQGLQFLENLILTIILRSCKGLSLGKNTLKPSDMKLYVSCVVLQVFSAAACIDSDCH